MNENLQISVVTDLSVEPVTLTEAKNYMKLSNTADDDYITDLIIDARQRLEQYTGLSFGAKTLQAYWTNFDTDVEIPYQPNAVVTACVNDDDDAVDYTTKGLNFKFISARSTEGLKLSYTVGWGAAGLPKALKDAILKEVSTNYRNRENYSMETSHELSSSAIQVAQSYSRILWF